jgi:AraC-like DNA-binding protein
VVLTLLVLLSVIVAITTSYNALKKEIIHSNKHVLKSTEIRFENVFEGIESIINNMISPSLGKVILNTPDSFSLQSNKLNLLKNELIRFRDVGRNLEQYFMYIEGDDIIIGSSTVLSPELYYDSYFKNCSVTYDEWLSLITTDSYSSLFTFEDNSTKKYAYVSKIPFEMMFGKQDISMVFIISEDYLSNINRQLLSDSDFRILLMFPNNDVINFSDDHKLDKLSIDNREGLVKIDNTKYFIIKSTNASKRTYICAIPNSSFFANLYRLTTFQIVIVLFFILIVVNLSLYFSKIHYSPIVSILNVIKRNNESVSMFNGNEYEVIKKNIEKLSYGNKLLSDKLGTQKANLRQYFLTRYLKGDSISEYYSLQEAFSDYDIDFRNGKYCVLLFTVTDFHEFSSVDSKDYDFEYNLCKFVINNIISELISENYYCIMHDVDSSLTCIVNFYDDIPDSRIQDELTEIYDKARDFIADNFKIYFNMTAGNIKSDPENVPDSYNEAIFVLERNSVFDENNIFSHRINDETSYKDAFDDNARKIIPIIRMGDFTKSSQALASFFNIIIMYSTTNPNLVRYEILGFIDSILKEISSMGKEAESFVENIAGKYQIEKFKNFNDLKNIMTDMIQEICEYTSSNFNNLEHGVMEYIEENYHDPDLSISKIAEYYNLNPYYLSATIKEKSGYGIVERINRARCVHAAEMLKSTRQTVKDISAASGYTNIHTFIRVFKKYYGCTPAQYR